MADRPNRKDQALIEDRLAYYLRCLLEDALDTYLTSSDRLAVVRDRARRIREIRRELEMAKNATGGRPFKGG